MSESDARRSPAAFWPQRGRGFCADPDRALNRRKLTLLESCPRLNSDLWPILEQIEP